MDNGTKCKEKRIKIDGMMWNVQVCGPEQFGLDLSAHTATPKSATRREGFNLWRLDDTESFDNQDCPAAAYADLREKGFREELHRPLLMRNTRQHRPQHPCGARL